MDRIKEIERRLNIMSSYKQQDLKMSERQEMYYDDVQYLLEENKRLRGIIHNLIGSAYELRQHALKTIHDKTELDIDKVIDSTDDMCKYAQQALREDDKDEHF